MRVVLVRLSALGDVVHTWPLATALRAACPDLHLTWVVEESLRVLVAGHPAVDRVVTTATRRWRRRLLSPTTLGELVRLRRTLRGGFELCLDPQGVVKSALVSAATAAPRRVGWARPWRRELLAGSAYTETLAPAADSVHIVARNLEMVRALALTPPRPTPPPDGRWLLTAQAPSAAEAARARAVLLPGAGRAGKMLPVEVLAEVARGLAAQGLASTVVWGPGERERAEAVVAACPTARLAPPTDLLELAHVLAAARLVVGGDTGPVHLAASLGTPTVGVFIASDPRRNGPAGRFATAVSNLDASARSRGRARVRRARPVAAEQILAAAVELLQRPAPDGC